MKFNFKKYNLIKCGTFFSKFRGLMFSKRKNLIFVLNKESRINSIIHTFFVFFPINVYWLDKNKNILEFKKVKPFSIVIPKKKAKYIVEITSRYLIYNKLP